MLSRKMLVLRKSTLELEEVTLNNHNASYEEIRDNVGGYIEHLSGYNSVLDKLHIGMWCNEEGKLKDDWVLDTSVAVVDDSGIIETFQGDIVFLNDSDDGESTGLSDQQISFVKDLFKERATLGMINKETKKIIDLTVVPLLYCH